MSSPSESRPPHTPPDYYPPPRKRTWVGRLLLSVVALLLVSSLMLNFLLMPLAAFSGLGGDRPVREKPFSGTQDAPNKIAVITVDGAILEGDGFVKRQIDRAAEDEKLRAVVLRVDSPGGSVTASDYIHHHLGKLAEGLDVPVVVSMGGLAASGGYYVSMAGGQKPNIIFAEPTTWTGSIGVIIPHYDISELLQNWHISDDSIVSHPYKDMGSMTREMKPEEREILQGLVIDCFDRFKSLVRQGRPNLVKDFTAGLQQDLDDVHQQIAELNDKLDDAADEDAKSKLEEERRQLVQWQDELKRKLEAPEEALSDSLFTGQVFTADAAQRYGLVDEIGFLEDAVARSMELAGLTEDDCEVVEYEREPTLASLLLGVDRAEMKPDLAMLLEGTAPRAYYLFTSLPPLLSTPKP